VARTRTRPAENNNGEKASAVSDRRRRQQQDEIAADAAADSAVTTRKDRPTPSTRQPKKGARAGLINRIPVVRGIVTYFRGVSAEMQKVTWPSREETTRLTAIVLGVTAAFAIGLGVLDTFFSWWFRQAFNADSEMIFLGIAALVVVSLGGGYFAFRDRI
jgi:preprotein translocase SecE subunit